jgi:outer membrane receptor for ferrienterochelin and colicins
MIHWCLRSLSVFLLLSSLLDSNSFAQSREITGRVINEKTHEGVPGANVAVTGTNLGAKTKDDGSFRIPALEAKSYVLRVSAHEYEAKNVTVDLSLEAVASISIDLEPEGYEGEEVVITGTRTQRGIQDAPIRVEAIPEHEIVEESFIRPSTVASIISEIPGLHQQITNLTSNTANIRIQGMQGRYTQFLRDGIPGFGALSMGISLTQLPPLNLRQVEIVKGASSVLYGGDAISGVINFITKEPEEHPELTFLVNATSHKGLDGGAYYAQKFVTRSSSVILE